MRIWRSLSIVGISALLYACSSNMFAPCPFPGAVPVQAPGDKTNPSPGSIERLNCLYRLTIKELDHNSQEIRATVAKSVVEEAIDKRSEFFSPGSWFTKYRIDEYPFHVFAFRVADQKTFNKLTVGAEYDFENIADTPLLKLCDDICLQDRQVLIKRHYESVDNNKLKLNILP